MPSAWDQYQTKTPTPKGTSKGVSVWDDPEAFTQQHAQPTTLSRKPAQAIQVPQVNQFKETAKALPGSMWDVLKEGGKAVYHGVGNTVNQISTLGQKGLEAGSNAMFGDLTPQEKAKSPYYQDLAKTDKERQLAQQKEAQRISTLPKDLQTVSKVGNFVGEQIPMVALAPELKVPGVIAKASPLIRLLGSSVVRGTENSAYTVLSDIASGKSTKESLKDIPGSFTVGALLNTVLSPKLVAQVISEPIRNSFNKPIRELTANESKVIIDELSKVKIPKESPTIETPIIEPNQAIENEALKNATQSNIWQAKTDTTSPEGAKYELENLKTQIKSIKDELQVDPAGQLKKYMVKGELPEVTGQGTGFSKEGDTLVTELGFNDSEEARNALNRYQERERQVKELQNQQKELSKTFKPNEVLNQENVSSTNPQIEPTETDGTPKPVQVEGELKTSKAYQRVKDRLTSVTENEPSYNKMNIENDTKKAIELVNNDENQALRIANGIDEPPVGQTETAISIAMADKAAERGDHALQAQLESSRSLRQTRRGQEIVSERGRFDDNSPHTYINQVIQGRMEKASKNVTSVESGLEKSSSKRVVKEIDSKVQEIKQLLKDKQITDNESALKEIDNLTCKV